MKTATAALPLHKIIWIFEYKRASNLVHSMQFIENHGRDSVRDCILDVVRRKLSRVHGRSFSPDEIAFLAKVVVDETCVRSKITDQSS